MSKVIKSSSGASSGGNKVTLTSAPTSSNNKQLPNISTKTIKSPSNPVSAGAKVDKTRSIDNSTNVIKLGNNYNLGNGSIGTIGKTRNVGKNIIGKTTYNAGTDKEASIYTIQRDSKYITSDYLDRLNAYFDSGTQNATDSRAFRNEAVIQMNQAYDPDEKAWWDNAIKYLDATVYNEYKGKIDRINASIAGYSTNLHNATNEFRSTQDLLGLQTDSLSAEYKDLFGRNQTASGQMKTAEGQLARANAIKTQLEDEVAGYFMDRETFEARERLEDNNYVGTERDLNLYATDPSALTNERSKKEMDQARLDAYNRSLGINEKFYNHEDKWKANTEATISDINSGIIGAFSDFNKIGYEFAKGVDRESFVVNPPKEKAQPVSVEQAIREKASVTSRIAILEKQEADIKRSAGTDALHLNDEAYSSVAAIGKELRDLKKKLGEYNDIINASGDGPTSLGYKLNNFTEDDFFGFLDRAQDNLDAQTAAKLNKAMQGTGVVEKFGMNLSRTMAEVGFDAAVQFATGVPALASMYVRVEGKASGEGRRVLAAREARGEDVNTEILGINLSARDKASIYGNATAGVEVLTERLGNGLGRIYGRGKAVDITEKVIAMLADTPDGMNFLRFIADSSGEGGEEVISDLIDPAFKCIINGESLKHNYSELEASELLYDYFLGWVMGLSGATSGLVSDGPEGYAAKNVDIYQNKVNTDIQARQNILREGLNQFNAVMPPEGSLAQQVIDATRGQGENSQTRQQRIVQMLQDPEQVKLFEQATGKEITGNTIADKWASVESILSDRTKGETILEETQTKLEEREKKDAPITKAIQKYQHGEDLNRSEISMLYAAGFIDKSQRDAMRQFEKADRLIAKSAAKTNERREFFIQQAQDNGVRTRAEKNSAPAFEGEARLANDEIEHNQANPPDSAVMAPQSVPASGGTDIATNPTESVKPTAEPLTRDDSHKAIENHEADNKKLANVVPIADAAVSAQKPVHKINGNQFAKTGEEGEPPLSKKVWNWLQQFFVKGEGPNIYSNKLKADVIISERGLKNDVSHHIGETKAATFEAIPYVIKDGMIVSKTVDDSGKVRSIIVAGKVYLNNKNGKNGKPVNVYCLLKADDAGQNRFYLHEVSDGKGNLYYQLSNAEKDASTALRDSTPQKQGSAEEASSAQSVPQTKAESKPAQQPESKSLPPIESRSTELTNLINRLSYSGADEIGPLVSLAKSDFDSLAKAYNELTGMELPKTGYESALRQLAADYSGLAVDEAADGMMADNGPLPVQQKNSVAEIQEQSAPKAEIESKSQNAEMDKPQSNTTEEETDEEPLAATENGGTNTKTESAKEQRPAPSGTETEHSEGELKKRTQVKGAKAEHEDRMADIAKKFGIDDGTFLSYTREEVSRIANYCIEKYGMQEEWNRLMGEKNWSRVDFSEAGKIVYEMTIQLNRDMTNGSSGLGPILERKPGESNKEYFERQKQSDKDAYLTRREPIDAMLQMYAQQKSEAGQKLQEQHKFTIADEIRMRASQRFLSYTEDGEVNNVSDLAKNAKMWNIIDDLLTRAEKADTSGSKDAMMDVTKLVSRIRGRETMWGRLGMKEESRMLRDLYNGGFDSDAMASLMYGGISKIIDDLTPMTYADVIQTVRMNNMLSSPATALNNFLNNANALRVGSIAQNAAYPFAKVFEALTGKKVAFTDTSFTRIGKGKMRAEKMAMEYALLSAYYGMDGERGRFDPKDSNTVFWLNGSGASGVAGRALARYNFLINAMVLSPDAPAKARANLGMKEGIERAFAGEEMTPEKARNKKELEAFADVETKRRVLQDDNGATRAVLWAKNQINKVHTSGGKTAVKGRQLGEFRLGDFAIAFAKVPANVGLQKVMATPYGAAFQMGRYAAGLIEAAHNPEGMDTIKMAKLSRDIGRAFTTWGMIGLGALGAMTGALKNFDDTDDDEEKKLAAEKGYNGLTFNVSALLRRGSEWKDGDLVVSGNFLEILALPLTIGAFMYDAQQEGMGTFEAINYGAKESFTHLVDAVMEIPGLQQVGQLWESYAANKNTGASDYERAMKSLGQFVANSSTSYLIPNLVAQTAAGLDNKQRGIYNTTAYGESLKNIWMAKIPGLREKLPEKTDTFGNTRTYGDNSIMAMVNTVLLPGDIKKYHVSELEKELLRLKKETGYNGTLFDTKAQRKIETGNGEVEYTLNPDQQRAFHMAKAKYFVEAFDKFRTSDEYKTLTDDQRLDVLKMLRMDAERMVKNECLEEAGVEDRIRIDKWEETLTNWDDKIQYLSAKQVASSLWDDENNAVANFEGMDKFMQGDYKNLTPEMKELITNSLGYLDDIESASKYKLTSEQWQTGHDIYRYYVDKIDASKTDDEKVTLAQESQMWADIQKATGATDHQMEYFEGDMKLWFQNTPNADQYYEYLKDAGMTRQEAANTIKTISDLKPQPGYEESDYIQASQRYIAICDTVPKDKQWAAFWTIVPSNAAKKKVAMMHDLQAQGVSLRTALSASGMGEIRGRTEIAPGKWKYYTISK